ncbi:MAG: hypothetical protein R3Y04_05870 [Rikenellaceae bacterium]
MKSYPYFWLRQKVKAEAYQSLSKKEEEAYASFQKKHAMDIPELFLEAWLPPTIQKQPMNAPC